MTEVFGRTNQIFPRLWLALLGRDPDPAARERLVLRALEAGSPLGVSSAPALWGPLLRDQEPTLVACGGFEIERARDSRHATDLVTAEIIALLSSLGRPTVDFYFLRVRRALEEHQIAGALEALESARDEGLLRFCGLRCDGPGIVALGLWRLHDAFEAVMAPRNPLDQSVYETLAPLARERRVGIVARAPFRWGVGAPVVATPGMTETAHGWLRAAMADSPVIVGVERADEIDALLADCPPVDGVEAAARYKSLTPLGVS